MAADWKCALEDAGRPGAKRCSTRCPACLTTTLDSVKRGLPSPDVRQGTEFTVKDSGSREQFESGMQRDTEDGKPDLTLIRKGPMFVRWATHMTKGALKYGRHNWTNANSEAELERFKRSAARHFEQWLAGERDEDHAAACFFNLNAAEFTADRLASSE